jgi:hypothetical protein
VLQTYSKRMTKLTPTLLCNQGAMPKPRPPAVLPNAMLMLNVVMKDIVSDIQCHLLSVAAIVYFSFPKRDIVVQ